MQSKTWAKVLTDSASGGALLQHARQLLRLRELVRGVLPRTLRDGYSVASFRPNEVVVFIAQNSSIASKIRHFEQSLREKFATAGIHITRIRVEIAPEVPLPAPDLEKRARLSPVAALELQRLADRLPADSAVAGALRSLARLPEADRDGPDRDGNRDKPLNRQ